MNTFRLLILHFCSIGAKIFNVVKVPKISEYLLVESVVKKADKTQELTKKIEKTAAEAGTSKKPEKSSEGPTKKPDKISTPVVSGTDENAEKDVTESGELETSKTGNKRATPRSAPSNSAKRRK